LINKFEKKIKLKIKPKPSNNHFVDGWAKNEWNCLPLDPFFSVILYMQV